MTNSEFRILNLIVRYGRSTKTRKVRIDHKEFCNIYRTDLPHCSCGLIYDLANVDDCVREKIYPDFRQDHAYSIYCDRQDALETLDRIESISQELEEVFGRQKEKALTKDQEKIVKFVEKNISTELLE